MDRRIERTKDLLKQALLSLLAAQDMKDISVTEITETANVGRSTFYRYYRDVEDLVKQVEAELIADIVAILQAGADDEQGKFDHPYIIHETFTFMENYRTALLTLAERDETFLKELKAQLTQAVCQILGIQTQERHRWFENTFFVSAMVDTVFYWMAVPDWLTRDEMEAYLCDSLARLFPVKTDY